MLKVTGLWKQKKKSGESFLAGNLGGARILVMKNQYKKEDNHPDYNVFLVERKAKEAEPGQAGEDMLDEADINQDNE